MREKLLDEIISACQPFAGDGAVASYIPELSKIDPIQLGIAIAEMDGTTQKAGDSDTCFTIQSIAKVFIFTCSLMRNSMSDIAEKVSVEPTAEAFNSIVNLETKNYHKPLNPMINSGAIACLTTVGGRDTREKFELALELVRRAAKNDTLTIDEAVYNSEKASGARNRALAYYMLSTGIIDEDVEDLLDAYFKICSIRMDCVDLATSALVFANNGVEPTTNSTLFSRETARIIKATLTMCGMYDESGRIAVEVGLPSKSGVGGGILSIAPSKLGIGVYGPALNPKGCSVAGLEALKILSRKLDLSIF